MQQVLNSYGGSIWQMVLEPDAAVTASASDRLASPEETSSLSSDNDSENDKNEEDNSEDDEENAGEMRVAIACDDGSLRLFTVKDGESLTYKKSFPRIEGISLLFLYCVTTYKAQHYC